MIETYGKKAEQTRLPLRQWLLHFISLFIWIFFNTVCWIFNLAFRTRESAELLKKFCFSRNETPSCKSHLSKHLWKHSECELQISLGDRQYHKRLALYITENPFRKPAHLQLPKGQQHESITVSFLSWLRATFCSSWVRSWMLLHQLVPVSA